MTQTRGIPGFPGYTVSSDGIVFGKNGARLRPNTTSGYCRVRLRVDGITRSVNLARLVLATFDPVPDWETRPIIWVDLNPRSNWLGNLRWGYPPPDI